VQAVGALQTGVDKEQGGIAWGGGVGEGTRRGVKVSQHAQQSQ